ncbi:MAG: sulfatase-like hydrolase/transferase [Bacteroidota bacterium]
MNSTTLLPLCSRIFYTGILISLLHCSPPEHEQAQTTNRPNVIFIMADDHTSQAVSAYGGILADVCPTPNIDRLATEGMLFNNCFVTNSICTPSRSAIFTGKYAHKNGVYKFTALDQSQPTIPKAMQKAGYHTALIGKYHLHSNPVGLDFYSLLPGQGRYHDPEFIEVGDTHPSGWLQQGKRTVYPGHSSDAIADKALQYLQHKRDPDKPFMLFCHFKAPHDTWEYAPRYEAFLKDVEIPEPENLFDDYEGRSDALRTQLQYIGSEWGNHTNFKKETAHLAGKAKKKMQYQLYMKKYLRCVKGVDDNVGRILDYLDASGLAENTIIMFTGDQGFYLGEHGMYDKRFMYEEGLRMPFLARWPAQIKKGSKSDGMILNIDMAPTILEAAGLPPLAGTQGRSFLPLTRGNIPEDWRTSMYYRYYYSHFETEPHLGVRTYDYKLIHYDGIDQWELYDMNKDRAEMKNLYGDSGYESITQELKAELIRLQMELGDDPQDDGSRPNIGFLAPNPLQLAEDVAVGTGANSLLFRFQPGEGGTLFSRCALEDVPYSKGFRAAGFKTLCIRKGDLFFFDDFDDDLAIRIEANLTDDQWHTVGLVHTGSAFKLYLDGELAHSASKALNADHPEHQFNVGAGIDTGGFRGYNFRGKMSTVLHYAQALTDEEVEGFSEGQIPVGGREIYAGN